MDTLKTMIQNSEQKLSMTNVAQRIFKEKGVRGFYEGLGVTVLRSAPSSAVVFVAYEFLNRWLGRLFEG